MSRLDRVVTVLGAVPRSELEHIQAAHKAELDQVARTNWQEGYEAGAEDEPSTANYATYGYRSASQAPRDLSSVNQDLAIVEAYRLWNSNPLGKRITELMVDFVIGEGARVVADNPAVQAVVDKFWKDTVNNFPLTQDKRTRELGLYGEQLYPAFVRDGSDLGTGGADMRVRLGVVDPSQIGEIITDAENICDLIAIRLKSATGTGKLYKVIRENEATGLLEGVNQRGAEGVAWEPTTCTGRAWRVTEAAPEPVTTSENGEWREGPDVVEAEYDGACFYFTVNAMLSGTRGRPDMLPLIDWLDRYDQLFFDLLEWAALIRSFVFDVTVEGADEATLRTRRTETGTPRSGSVIWHNEKEKWEAVNPDLKGGDFETIVHQARVLIAGGAGVPEHFLAEGSYGNRATASEMGEPTFRMFAGRQRYVKYMFEYMVKFAVDQAVLGGVLPMEVPVYKGGVETAEVKPAREAFAVVMPDITSRDTAAMATVLLQIVQAVVTAQVQGLIPEQPARELIAAIVAAFGVEYNPADSEGEDEGLVSPELAQALQEALALVEE